MSLVTSLIRETHSDYQESKHDIASYEICYRAVSVSLAHGIKLGGWGLIPLFFQAKPSVEEFLSQVSVSQQ